MQIVDDTIEHVVRTGDQVQKLISREGREYAADFFVDCWFPLTTLRTTVG